MGNVIYTDNPGVEVRKVVEETEAEGVFIITDRNVAPWIDKLGMPRGAGVYVLEPGERSKSIETAIKLWGWLGKKGATRKSLVINFGGGVVSDVGGFVASTFKRGIRYVNVPTTLLAAADASIGGKTGIDFGGLKNEVGTFAMPEQVIISTVTFGTLSREEILSGFGEVVKMALLTDKGLYEELLEGDALSDRELMGRALRNAAEQKERIVALDPREDGLRRILNLGHTAGHAYEMLAARRGKELSHGEAVAHGIYTALRLSERYCGLSPVVGEEYKARILDRYYGRLPFGAQDNGELIELMLHDKKNRRDGEVMFVLVSP